MTIKILLISEGSLVTVFPTLEFLIELMGLAFLDFRPFPRFFHISQVSIEKLISPDAYIYVIHRLGGPYREKLCPRS